MGGPVIPYLWVLVDFPPLPRLRSGYPWIDAIMTQLREWGWMHHLARHSVACFLTRGDMYISWERGMEVFEELLIDQVWRWRVSPLSEPS